MRNFYKNLKNIFTLLTILLLGSINAWGAWTGSGQGTNVNGTWYVLYDNTERSISPNLLGNHVEYNYNLSGPGATLTFDAKRSKRAAVGNLVVGQNVKGSWSNVYDKNPGTSYEGSGNIGLNVDASELSFYNNYGSYTRYFKNVRVTMAQYVNAPSANSLDFGSADINSTATSKTVTVAWCNVPAMTYTITGANASLFEVSVANNSEAGKYNTATFTVKYKHTTAGTHSATLTISDSYGNYSKTVTLSGTTKKLTPTVNWSSNDAVFNVDDVLSATNKNGLTVRLSVAEADKTYVGCLNNTATMLAAKTGTVTITAHVTGSDIYADNDTITKEITITNLEKQYITWGQEFSRLKTTDGTKSITLNATSSSGLAVSYELQGDKTGLSLTKNGNTWTLTYSASECTNTTIVAKQAGNGTYATASSVSKPVKVIDPTKVCSVDETLVNSTVTLKSDDAIYNIEIPSSMTIQVSRTKTGLFDVYLNGFNVEIYSGQNGTGTKLHEYSYNASDINNSKTISLSDLNIAAKSVKLISNASNGYNVTSVTYKKYKYCNLKDNNNNTISSLSFETYPNTTTSEKTFKVDYANYPITIECSNSKFAFTPTEFGDCSEYDTKTISVTYTAGEEEGNDVGYLYIKDNTNTTLRTCTLNVSVSKVAQSITSHTIGTAYNTTDRIELSAESNSKLTEFVYSANPAGVASFDGNVMTFSQSGTIAITVTQEGTNVYKPCSLTVNNVVVSKVTPTIVTNPAVATIKYLDNLDNSQLSEGLATVTLRGVENTEVEGSFEWTKAQQVVAANGAGNYDYSVTFKPTNTGMYNNKVFDQTITISRADASIVMNDGSVKVKIVGVNDNLNEWKIDLDDLIASQTTDAIAASRAGAVSYKVLSNNAEYASIDVNSHEFSATRCGEYTIEVTKAQTDWYKEAKDTFLIKVEKLDPVVVFDNTDDPHVLYTLDILDHPAARYYNGQEISREIVYTSEKQAVLQVNNTSTKLKALEVQVNEGESVPVKVSAYSAEDDFYNQSETVEKHYAVYAKRSPHFTMEGQVDAHVSKTLKIGETATITYNENTDASFAVGTSSEHEYVTFTNDAEKRVITVTAVKGNLSGDGEQVITLTQPGTTRLYQRQINYTFTVQRYESSMSLEPLVTNMHVEDTVSTIFTNLANTTDDIQFSCSPEAGLKMEDGKLIALQAGQYTVTFSQPNTEYWTGVSQSKTITVSKLNTQINWNLDNQYAWFSTIHHPFSSSNTMAGCDITVTSSDEKLAKYFPEEDKIVVYGVSGNVTFTLNQVGNYKYNAVEKNQRSFTIFRPNNRLPMNLSSSNWTDYRNSNSGSLSWDDGGLLCGETSFASGFNYLAKYVVLSFTGVPDQLSFDFKNASSVATQYGYHFYQSSTGEDGSWVLLKEYDDLLMNATGGTSEGSEQLALLPSTRFIKLEYHGNFGARFKNVVVTARKEIKPRSEVVDFGLGYNGNEPTARTIALDWYNVNNCEVSIIGENADRFILAEGDEVINSLLDNYGDATLHVSYKHDVNTATTHTATLHIVEKNPNGTDGQTADITLVGQTTQAPQMIIWREDLTPMPSEGEFAGAAYSTSGLDIELTSLNPEIVRVGGEDGLTLYPVSPGVTKVRAYQAGDDKWAEVTDIIEIEVTTKHVQYITWNDNLSNLKREENKTKTVNLTATASSGLEISYTLDEAASQFASVNGNVLTLNGWGTGYITARQAGNDEYVAVQKKKKLVSRNPNAGCNPTVEEDSYPDGHTIWTLGVREIGLTGEPASIEFDAKCSGTALYGLWVGEYYDGYWHEIKQISRFDMGTNYTHYGPYNLTRRATAVRIYTETGATMNRTFKNVEVKLAKYIELESNEMNFTQLDKGATKVQSFYVNYSNITGAFDVQLEDASSQFEVLTTTIGEDCGDAAKNVRIDIKCTGKNAGVENNAIIISNYDQYLRVPVSANVVLPSQAITWNPDVTERAIKTTDNIELIATATSGLDVNLESDDTEVAEVVNNAGVYTLNIHKYGDVTITASQTGNDSWSSAVEKPVVFHISRVIPVITEYPTTDAIFSSRSLSECALNGGAVEGNIPGEFRWVNPEQVITYENTTYQAMFLPENTNYYEPVIFDVTLDVISNTQTITWTMPEEINALCTDLIEFDAVASSGLPIMYLSSDSLVAYVENNTLRVIKYGTVTITANQPGDDCYLKATPLSTQITLSRNSLVVETKPEVTQIYVGHSLSDAKFVDAGVVKAGEIEIDGKYSWQEDPIFDATGKYTFTAIFTPYNIGWYEPVSCEIDVEVISAFVFTGNGSWDDGITSHWKDERIPDGGGNDDVVIAASATLTITQDDVVEVQNLTVSGSIVLEDDASMTVTGDLILEASLGDFDGTTLSSKSGQLIGAEISDSLKVGGEVYFHLALDPSGECSPGWYDFTVPFEVDALHGITRFDNTTGEEKTIINEVNYAIMDYSESRRLETGYGWKKFRGIMQPGKCYAITIDDVDNVYRFKKVKGGSFYNKESETLAYTPTEDKNRGWNGLGNGTLAHVDLNAAGIEKVQIYSHKDNSFTAMSIDNCSFAVGTAYFIQAPNSESAVTYTPQSSKLIAPRRAAVTKNSEFKLTLTREGASIAADRLYVGATEESVNEYEIGRDLSKCGNPTEAKVAQVWVNAYGMQLCDIDMPLKSNKANCNLGLYAPQSGIYSIEIEEAPADATLYLTYNNRVIWNLSMSSYEIELNQGTTEGYGLRIVADAKTTTDLENVTSSNSEDGVRKVLIDDKIYMITPEGAVYDVLGKGVKY